MGKMKHTNHTKIGLNSGYSKTCNNVFEKNMFNSVCTFQGQQYAKNTVMDEVWAWVEHG